MRTNTHCLPCKATKSNGKRCNRRTHDPDGYCHQHGPEKDVLASRRPGWVEAVIAKATGGEFARFRKGERVRAWKDEDGSFTIERFRWSRCRVPLVHACFGIEADCLTFPDRKP